MTLDMRFCSGPLWADVRGIRAAACDELVRHAARSLMDLPAIITRAPDLVPPLSSIASAADFLRPAWTPSVRQPHDWECAFGQDWPLVAALQLVLEFVEHCPPFAVALAFVRPVRFIVDPVILPFSTILRGVWDGSKLHIDTPSPGVVIATASTRTATFCDEWGRERVSVLEQVGELTLLGHAGNPVFEELGTPIPVGELPSMQANLRDASCLLRKCAPEYLNWICPMIRWVVPLATPVGGYASGGGAHAPGVVAASGGCSPVVLAESLVHEAAHQYVFLVSRFGNVAVTDDRLYYSPLAKRLRPLDRIAVAFHAAANISLLYDLVLERDGASGPSASEVERNSADCIELHAHLAGNPLLTDLGRALIDPISECLRSRGVL